jgi:hypothetical protein
LSVSPRKAGNEEQYHHQHHVEFAGRVGRQGTGRKQQRVAGQEGHDHHPGFHENDQEQDQVRPGTVVGGNCGEVLVEVQKNINDLLQEFHKRSEEVKESWRLRMGEFGGRRYRKGEKKAVGNNEQVFIPL